VSRASIPVKELEPVRVLERVRVRVRVLESVRVRVRVLESVRELVLERVRVTW
jgi:hypothetical protein